MSLASTSPAPPATAGPLTDAMIGLGSSIICHTNSRYSSAASPHSCSRSGSGKSLVECISCTSMPAQNALPAPVRIIARTRFSRCMSPKACCNWPSIERVSALQRPGRLSTIVPTASVTFTSTASLDMYIGKGSGDRGVRGENRRVGVGGHADFFTNRQRPAHVSQETTASRSDCRTRMAGRRGDVLPRCNAVRRLCCLTATPRPVISGPR